MENTIEQIVKEFMIRVPGLPYQVRGRITVSENVQNGEKMYHWDTSHKYGKKGGHLYFPSQVSDTDPKTVEAWLLRYMVGLTADCEIEPNALY